MRLDFEDIASDIVTCIYHVQGIVAGRRRLGGGEQPRAGLRHIKSLLIFNQLYWILLMKKLLVIAMLVLSVSGLSLAQRTLINKGDHYIGATIALGSVVGASMGYVASFEMGLQKNIGIGATLGYSGYSETSSFYDVKFSNILIMANGNYHMDVLKSDKLDTWGSISLGYNVQSASATYVGAPLPYGMVAPSWSGSASSGLIVGGTLNARYMLSNQLYATASVGFGLGLLNIGIDYRL